MWQTCCHVTATSRDTEHPNRDLETLVLQTSWEIAPQYGIWNKFDVYSFDNTALILTNNLEQVTSIKFRETFLWVLEYLRIYRHSWMSGRSVKVYCSVWYPDSHAISGTDLDQVPNPRCEYTFSGPTTLSHRHNFHDGQHERFILCWLTHIFSWTVIATIFRICFSDQTR